MACELANPPYEGNSKWSHLPYGSKSQQQEKRNMKTGPLDCPWNYQQRRRLSRLLTMLLDARGIVGIDNNKPSTSTSYIEICSGRTHPTRNCPWCELMSYVSFEWGCSIVLFRSYTTCMAQLIRVIFLWNDRWRDGAFIIQMSKQCPVVGGEASSNHTGWWGTSPLQVADIMLSTLKLEHFKVKKTKNIGQKAVY